MLVHQSYLPHCHFLNIVFLAIYSANISWPIHFPRKWEFKCECLIWDGGRMYPDIIYHIYHQIYSQWRVSGGGNQRLSERLPKLMRACGKCPWCYFWIWWSLNASTCLSELRTWRINWITSSLETNTQCFILPRRKGLSKAKWLKRTVEENLWVLCCCELSFISD